MDFKNLLDTDPGAGPTPTAAANNHFLVAAARENGRSSRGVPRIGTAVGVPRVITVNSPTKSNNGSGCASPVGGSIPKKGGPLLATATTQITLPEPTPKMSHEQHQAQGIVEAMKSMASMDILSYHSPPKQDDDNCDMTSQMMMREDRSTSSSSRVAPPSVLVDSNSASASGGGDSAAALSRGSGTSYSLPPPRNSGNRAVTAVGANAAPASAAPIVPAQSTSKNKSPTSTISATREGLASANNGAANNWPPRPVAAPQQLPSAAANNQQRQRQRQRRRAPSANRQKSIAFQHGEDATTLCSSAAEEESGGMDDSAQFSASAGDSLVNSVATDDDGYSNYDDLAGNAHGYDCDPFWLGIDAQDDFYDDLSLDSQVRDGMDRRTSSSRRRDNMRNMASSLKKRVNRVGRKGKSVAFSKTNSLDLDTGGDESVSAPDDLCSPSETLAKTWQNYLHTYKFDTMSKTPTASNKTSTSSNRRARRSAGGGRPKFAPDLDAIPDDDIAVATSTIPPFHDNLAVDETSTSRASNEQQVCPICSSKLIHQHRKVILAQTDGKDEKASAVATATETTASATKPHRSKSTSAVAEDCAKCAKDNCPSTFTSFFTGLLSSTTTKEMKEALRTAERNRAETEFGQSGDDKKLEWNTAPERDSEDKSVPIPPYCTECRTYIVTETADKDLREEMLTNLSEWMVATGGEEGEDENIEDDEDEDFTLAAIKALDDDYVTLDRPLRGNIFVVLAGDEDKGVARRIQGMDEQSVTTHQQENLSPQGSPMRADYYPGLHLVSSGEVEARGREVLPPPPPDRRPMGDEQGRTDSQYKKSDTIFASKYGPPTKHDPTDDVGTMSAERTDKNALGQSASVRTEDEEAEMIATYPTKREIATKVIGSKLLNGYTLTSVQCGVCDMPMMEREQKCKCVVCPVIKRKAKKIASEKRGKQDKVAKASSQEGVHEGQTEMHMHQEPSGHCEGKGTCNSEESAAEDKDVQVQLNTASKKIQEYDEYIHLPQSQILGDEHSRWTRIPFHDNTNKIIDENVMLELVEEPVAAYFQGLDSASNNFLGGWHLLDEEERCSSCARPTMREGLEGSDAHCFNPSCKLSITYTPVDHPEEEEHQKEALSSDSDDDECFDLDDPEIIALQKLAVTKKVDAVAVDNNVVNAAAGDDGDEYDEDDPEIMALQLQGFNEDEEYSGDNETSIPVTNASHDERCNTKNETEHFTFARRGCCSKDTVDKNDKNMRYTPHKREIHCDDISSCSSLSFVVERKSHGSRTVTTGIETSKSESSDDTSMSALVEKMQKAKRRILNRVERRTVNRRGPANADMDMAMLIERLASAAKEVEDLDDCIRMQGEISKQNYAVDE